MFPLTDKSAFQESEILFGMKDFSLPYSEINYLCGLLSFIILSALETSLNVLNVMAAWYYSQYQLQKNTLISSLFWQNAYTLPPEHQQPSSAAARVRTLWPAVGAEQIFPFMFLCK